MFWPQGEAAYRLWRGARHRRETESAQKGGEDDDRLLRGEAGADADSRAGAEREPRVAHFRSIFRIFEAARLEGMGACPVFGITLDQPRRHDEHGAGLQLLVPHLRGAAYLARHEGDGGIKPKRFAENIADEGQMPKHFGLKRPVCGRGQHLIMRHSLRLRIAGQAV